MHKQFPFWGNSFGSPYREGIDWLNKNASPNAKVVFARELLINVPIIWLRNDLDLQNTNRSGYLRQGEYVIGLNYQGVENTSYFDRYLAKMLTPVHAIEVDGVPILKIWKNSGQYTKTEFKNEISLTDFKMENMKDKIRFDFGRIITLSQIKGDFETINCSQLKSGYVMISEDGLNWARLPGTMPNEDWSVPKLGDQPLKNSVLIPFAADRARFVDLIVKPDNACLKNSQNIEIKYFK